MDRSDITDDREADDRMRKVNRKEREEKRIAEVSRAKERTVGEINHHSRLEDTRKNVEYRETKQK